MGARVHNISGRLPGRLTRAEGMLPRIARRSAGSVQRHRAWALMSSVLILLLCAAASAQVKVSLPLNGHYRPGKYMPVRVVATLDNANSAAVTLSGTRGSAPDVLPTVLPLIDGRADAIVPLLPLRSPVYQITWSVDDGPVRPVAVPLHALSEDQKLVGFTAIDMEIARAIFPEHRIIPMQLDPADPLPGPAAAWETLDAVVFDSGAHVSDARCQALLANGTSIVVRSSTQPDTRWPWRQVGDCWVLAPRLLGPRAVISEDAYRPTYSWLAGWPRSFRTRIVLAGVLFSLAAILLCLWRWAWLAVVPLAAVAVALVAWWRVEQSPLLQVSGAVIIHSSELTQTDRWFYQTSPDPLPAGFAIATLTHPFFASPSHARGIDMTLTCRNDGTPIAFAYQLPPKQRLAFCARQVTPPARPPADLMQPVLTPLRTFVRQLYEQHDTTLLGELPGTTADEWPGVVMQIEQ